MWHLEVLQFFIPFLPHSCQVTSTLVRNNKVCKPSSEPALRCHRWREMVTDCAFTPTKSNSSIRGFVLSIMPAMHDGAACSLLWPVPPQLPRTCATSDGMCVQGLFLLQDKCSRKQFLIVQHSTKFVVLAFIGSFLNLILQFSVNFFCFFWMNSFVIQCHETFFRGVGRGYKAKIFITVRLREKAAAMAESYHLLLAFK